MIFKNGFKHRHAIIPVIRACDQVQVLTNAEWAYYAKADGVFLINQTRRGIYGLRDLSTWANAIKRHFPDWWVGINFLGKPIEHTFLELHKWEGIINGVWADNAGISETDPTQPAANALKKFAEAHCNPRGVYKRQYFGGVAFNPPEPVKDLAALCKAAMPFVDVLTTSGPKKGEEASASVEKIKTIREAVGKDFPIAIASGISELNITNYLPYADCFLVSANISDNYEYFNADAIRKLVKLVRRWKEPRNPAPTPQPEVAQVAQVAPAQAQAEEQLIVQAQGDAIRGLVAQAQAQAAFVNEPIYVDMGGGAQRVVFNVNEDQLIAFNRPPIEVRIEGEPIELIGNQAVPGLQDLGVGLIEEEEVLLPEEETEE